jgi:uncharacterized membrane protein YhaH (DUF805 family)
MNAYLDAMRKYATFSGRATRSQYWQFILVLLAISIAAMAFDAAVSSPISRSELFLGLTYAVHFLPNLAVTTRRLHDTGRSGWWIVVPPVAIFFLCQPSSQTPNCYGAATVQALAAEGNTAGGNNTAFGAQRHATTINMTDELERLAQLKASGSLSETEFEVMKSRLLAKSL